MKKIIMILTTIVSTTTFASDSHWKMCQGNLLMRGHKETILVNLYEYRLSYDKRATDLTLIFGGHLLNGSFDSTETNIGTVTLVQDKNASKFSGVAFVDDTSETLSLKGQLDISNYQVSVDSILSCKTIRD